MKLFDKNQLEDANQQYQPTSMIEGLLPNGILPPAELDRPEPSVFDISHFTRHEQSGNLSGSHMQAS